MSQKRDMGHLAISDDRPYCDRNTNYSCVFGKSRISAQLSFRPPGILD